MRSYQAGRRYFGFIEIVCRGVILICILVLVLSYFGIQELGRDIRPIVSPIVVMLGFPLGLAIMFSGFMGIVVVQASRASVDSAEYAQQGLQIAREQLAISRKSQLSGQSPSTSYEDLQAAKDDLRAERAPNDASYAPTRSAAGDGSTAENVTEYRGHSIEQRDGKFFVGRKRFDRLVDAKVHLDVSLGAPPEADNPTKPV